MNNKLYWIRLPWMTDPFTQGYVGLTKKPIEKRFDEHKNRAKKCKKDYDDKLTLHKAIINFPDELIIEILHDGLNRITAKFVERGLRDKWKIGWNMAKGGGGGYMSYETRAKMSAASKGKKHSDEARAKISAAKMGKKRSDEARAKMSAAKIGKKCSDETKAKMSAAQMGRKRSDETKAKMSAAKIGRKHSDEARAKISATKKRNMDLKRKNDEQWQAFIQDRQKTA